MGMRHEAEGRDRAAESVALRMDGGYQFGLGAFETIAVHQGRPVMLDAHLRRLAEGLRALGLYGARIGGAGSGTAAGASGAGAGPDAETIGHAGLWLPESIAPTPVATADETAHAVRRLVHQDDASGMRMLVMRSLRAVDAAMRDTNVRPTTVPDRIGGPESRTESRKSRNLRGIGVHAGTFPSAANRPFALKIMASESNLAFSIRTNPYESRNPNDAMRLVVADVRRNETSPLTRHKTLNQGDNILTARAAQAAGYDGALLLNTRGEVAETTVANIFLAKRTDAPGFTGVRLVTPPPDCGLLPGTLRSWVAQRTNVVEERLTLDDFSGYDECFVTNALMGVWPVASIDVPGQGVMEFPVHTAARMLRARYRAEFGLSRDN